MNLLEDVMDLLNELGGLIRSSWSIQLFFLGGRKG
jgi:hypothetical protein